MIVASVDQRCQAMTSRRSAALLMIVACVGGGLGDDATALAPATFGSSPSRGSCAAVLTCFNASQTHNSSCWRCLSALNASTSVHTPDGWEAQGGNSTKNNEFNTFWTLRHPECRDPKTRAVLLDALESLSQPVCSARFRMYVK